MADQNRNIQAGTTKMGSVPEKTVVTKKGRFSLLEAAQSNDTDSMQPPKRSSPPRHLRSKSALPTSPIKRTIGGPVQGGLARSNSFPVGDTSNTTESPPANHSVQKKGRFLVSSSDPNTQQNAPQQRVKSSTQPTLIQPTQTPQIVRINQARLPIAATNTFAQTTSKTTSLGSNSSSSVSSPSDRPATGTTMINMTKPIHRNSGPSGMGKAFHFLEQMKQEVTEADKLIKSLQSDNKFLRGKNKELEARCNDAERRYAEEQVSRERCELIIRNLRKQVANLIEEKSKLQNANEIQIKESQGLNIQDSSIAAVNMTDSGVEVNQIQSETPIVPVDGEQASLGSLVSFASLELLNATTTETKITSSEPRKEEILGTVAPNHFDPLVDKDLSKGGRGSIDSSTVTGGSINTNFDPLGSKSKTKTSNPSFDPLNKENPSEASRKNCQKQESDGIVSRVTGTESTGEKSNAITHQSPEKSDKTVTPRASNLATPIQSFDPYEKDKL